MMVWEDIDRKRPRDGEYLPVPTDFATCKTLPRQNFAPGDLWWGCSTSNVVPLIVHYDLTEYPEEEIYIDDVDDDDEALAAEAF